MLQSVLRNSLSAQTTWLLLDRLVLAPGARHIDTMRPWTRPQSSTWIGTVGDLPALHAEGVALHHAPTEPSRAIESPKAQ